MIAIIAVRTDIRGDSAFSITDNLAGIVPISTLTEALQGPTGISPVRKPCGTRNFFAVFVLLQSHIVHFNIRSLISFDLSV